MGGHRFLLAAWVTSLGCAVLCFGLVFCPTTSIAQVLGACGSASEDEPAAVAPEGTQGPEVPLPAIPRC